MAQPHNQTLSTASRIPLTAFFKRNAKLIAGVGLFVTFWMLVYTFAVFKPQYAAKSTVIIKDSAITGRYIEPERDYALQTTSSSSSNPVLNTMGILKSHAISNALWEYFKAKHPEELKKNKIKTKKDWDSFFQDGSSFIKAKNQPGTDLISLQFSWESPVIAKEALDVVVKAFQNASRDLNKTEQISRAKFLAKQVVEIEKELKEIRRKKAEYQQQKKTVSVRREGDDLAGTRMELENKLSQLESQARGKEQQAMRYQHLLGMSSEQALKAAALGQNSTMSRLRDELYRLQQLHSNLSASLTDNNPKVKEVLAQIEQTKADIAEEKARTIGEHTPDSDGDLVADGAHNTLIANLLQAQGEASDLRGQIALVRKRLSEINSDISSFPEMAEGLASLEQKEASVSLALDQLRQKVLEGKIKEDQTLSNVFVVDVTRLPDKAQFPTRLHLIVLSFVLGLGMGVAAAFGKEQLLADKQAMPLPRWLEPLESEEAEAPSHYTPAYSAYSYHPESQMQTYPTAADSGIPQTTAIHPSQPAYATEPKESAEENPETYLVHPILPTSSLEERMVSASPTGSLFESLLPIAGPMAKTISYPTEPQADAEAASPSAEAFRKDLTQPLPQPKTVNPPVEAMISDWDDPLAPPSIETAANPLEVSLPKTSQTQVPLVEASPEILAPVPQVSPSPATQTQDGSFVEDPTTLPNRVVKTAPPPSAEILHRAKPTQVMPSPSPLSNEALYGIPSMHAAPSPAEPAILATEEENASIPEYQEDQARTLYESQAKTMPLPRRQHRIPDFLLEGRSPDAPEAPYTLIPKKQLADPAELQAPDIAPASQSQQAFETSLQSFDAHSSSTDNELTTEDWPPSMPLTHQAPRRSLLGALFGKKASKNPQAHFGLGARAQRGLPQSGSLNRTMQALAQHSTDR